MKCADARLEPAPNHAPAPFSWGKRNFQTPFSLPISITYQQRTGLPTPPQRHEDILAALRVGDAEKAVRAIQEQTAYLRERFDAAQAMNRRKVDARVA